MNVIDQKKTQQVLTKEDSYIVGVLHDLEKYSGINVLYSIWKVHGLQASQEIKDTFFIHQITYITQFLLRGVTEERPAKYRKVILKI